MRILICNWRDLKHPRAGGAEVYTEAVATEWVKMGHSVTLFSSLIEGEPVKETAIGGYEVIRRGSRHSVYREAKKFWKKEGKGSFDLVIDEVNTRPFGCPKYVKQIPVVALIHQVAREVWFYETPWILAMVGRYLLEPLWLKPYQNLTTVTVSQSSKESLQSYGLKKIVVIPEGFYIQSQNELETIKETNESKEKDPTLIFVGRLAPNKRPGDAIIAFGIVKKLFPNSQLWIVGGGPLEAKLKQKAFEGVTFFGYVSEHLKQSLIAKAHILMVTSVREGWGLVVSEAAMLGTPTIGYDVAGLRDSIESTGGILAMPNPSALGEKIKEVLPLWIKEPPNVRCSNVLPWDVVARRILEVIPENRNVTFKQEDNNSQFHLIDPIREV